MTLGSPERPVRNDQIHLAHSSHAITDHAFLCSQKGSACFAQRGSHGAGLAADRSGEGSCEPPRSRADPSVVTRVSGSSCPRSKLTQRIRQRSTAPIADSAFKREV